VDDEHAHPRAQLPTYVYDFMLKTYGIKSLAMQNLANLIGSVAKHSDQAAAEFSRRAFLFGQLSGILDPLEYHEHYAGMLTQGGQGGRPAPLASRLHRIPTHSLLNLHGI
jgi:hypothetical protein